MDDRRKEMLDDTPVCLPVRLKRTDALTEQIRRVIREEASRRASDAGFESFEEADDFEIEDDYDPRSPHELSLDQELEGYGTTTEVSENEPGGNSGDGKSGGRSEGGNSAEGGTVEEGREGPAAKDKGTDKAK